MFIIRIFVMLTIIISISGCYMEDNNELKLMKEQRDMVDRINRNTPIMLDENTLLSGVFISNEKLTYRYNINGNLDDQNQWVVNLKDILPKNYCQNNEMKTVRNLFPNGIRYAYYMNNELFVSYDLNPSICAIIN